MLLSAAEGAGLARDRLRLALEADLPLVRADGAQLERAFANLLENARRFSGDHPVAVRARADGDRLTVRVVDRGPGIPHARLRHLFEPFWRAPGEHGGGAGLGLAIVRGFVEANGRAGVGRVAARPGGRPSSSSCRWSGARPSPHALDDADARGTGREGVEYEPYAGPNASS